MYVTDWLIPCDIGQVVRASLPKASSSGWGPPRSEVPAVRFDAHHAHVHEAAYPANHFSGEVQKEEGQDLYYPGNCCAQRRMIDWCGAGIKVRRSSPGAMPIVT